jgi:ureidoacrylate peracid hydrolase
MKLHIKDTALVVVDMQNAFLDEKGSMVARGFDTTPLLPSVDPCAELIGLARAAGVQVVYTRFVYRPDYKDAGVAVRHFTPNTITTNSLTAGTWDVEIIERLAPQLGDIVIDKNRPSAFINTPLEGILRNLRIRSLVICGITTNICVETTARDASQRDYETFVVSDATAEYDSNRYAVALQTLGFLFARIVTVDDTRKAWAAA